MEKTWSRNSFRNQPLPHNCSNQFELGSSLKENYQCWDPVCPQEIKFIGIHSIFFKREKAVVTRFPPKNKKDIFFMDLFFFQLCYMVHSPRNVFTWYAPHKGQEACLLLQSQSRRQITGCTLAEHFSFQPRNLLYSNEWIFK